MTRWIRCLATRLRHPIPFDPHSERDRGQATAEYALVLLGAAMVALILVGWATGGGAGKVGSLLDSVIDAVTGSF